MREEVAGGRREGAGGVRTEGQSGLKSGDTLMIGFDAARLHLFDVTTEIRL